jgi:hypothetical protein
VLMDNIHREIKSGDTVGQRIEIGCDHYRPPLRASFSDASYLNVIVPSVLSITIEVIGINFGLKGWIPFRIAGCSLSGRKNDLNLSDHSGIFTSLP